MTSNQVLVHTLERTLVIEAERQTVFRFFTDTARWEKWWGSGSSIDPHVGGSVAIRYPDGTEAVGAIVEIAPPERFVFTYGYKRGTPIPPGASLVTIVLEPHAAGTTLRLSHAFADAAVRDEHVQGWRYQLSLFANAIADDLHAGAERLIDRWFAAWSEPDAAAREAGIQEVAAEQIRMRDRFSAVAGISDLREHLAAVHRFMPGMRLERDGAVRHCQGMVLANWVARAQDGGRRAAGTNVFVLDAQGRIGSVTGFWNAG